MDQFIQECYPRFDQIASINVKRMNRINCESYNKLLSNQSVFIRNRLNQCTNSIMLSLSQWNGVTKSKKECNQFKDYFRIARNTFDQQKIKILTHQLWIPIIDRVSEVLLCFVYLRILI